LLEVFSGKAGPLNRLVFEILRSKALASYDIYLEVRRVKGFKHRKYQAVDRRLKKLHEQGWLILDGAKKTKPGTEAPIYRLSSSGPTALEMDTVSRELFLSDASDELQSRMTELLAVFREEAKRRKTRTHKSKDTPK
jgi:hypothetical protein